MKNFHQPIKTETFKFITIHYPPQLESVKWMVKEHYDIPEYADTLFLINTTETKMYDGEFHHIDTNIYTQHRKIYYNFEHTVDFLEATYSVLQFHFEKVGVTEIWSFEPNENLNAVYMPVRYTTFLGKVPQKSNKKFDLGFVGIVGSNDYSRKRNDFLHDFIVTPKYDFSINIMNGYQTLDLKDELANCRFVLDSKRDYQIKTQNQVRLFEHICMGQTVLSEKSDYNAFPGLIYEWETIDELNELIHTVEPQDFSEKYKELTYTDKAYEKYKGS